MANVRIFVFLGHSDPCHYFRFRLPVVHLHERLLKDYGIEVALYTDLPKDGSKFDVYMLHGVLAQQNFPIIGNILESGAKFVYSVDDDYRSVPKWNPAYPSMTNLGCVTVAERLATHILTSTDYLADKVRKFNPDKSIITCPNLVDLNDYHNRTREQRNDDGVTRILWFGSETHIGDFDPIVNKLIEVIKAGNVGLTCFGDCHPKLRNYLGRGVLELPKVPITQYFDVLNSIDADIAICPLADTEFNKSKSWLKSVECFGSGLAVMAAGFNDSPYDFIHNIGRTYHSPDSFKSGLLNLIEDISFRRSLAVKGFDWVSKYASWQSEEAVQPWIEFFRKIAFS